MTNTTGTQSTTEFLNEVESHTAFFPFQTSSGEEGFEFTLLVTAREFWIVMGVLQPIIEAGEADMKIEFDMNVRREYRLVSVDMRGRGTVEVGMALISAYDRINANG